LSSLLRADVRARGEIEARQSWTISAARLAVAAPWITLVLLCTRAEAASAYRSALGAVILLICAALTVLAYRLMLLIGRLPVEPRTLA
jgi:tight adherence protein B